MEEHKSRQLNYLDTVHNALHDRADFVGSAFECDEGRSKGSRDTDVMLCFNLVIPSNVCQNSTTFLCNDSQLSLFCSS
jgi:hypothetical protein